MVGVESFKQEAAAQEAAALAEATTAAAVETTAVAAVETTAVAAAAAAEAMTGAAAVAKAQVDSNVSEVAMIHSVEAAETAEVPGHQLEPAGLCDESQCRVLGVEALKARRLDLINSVRTDQVAEVQLICKYAREKVNVKDSVMLLIYMLRLILVWLWDRMGKQLFISLPAATRRRRQSCF